MKNKYIFLAFVFGLVGLLGFGSVASADHSWEAYHWGRTANPFTLKLGDNLSSAWDAYLSTASSDWTASSVLNTTIVPGLGGRYCKATLGRVEVCNKKYGNNGWLGIAQIWISGNHITKGVTKMNDTYFSRAPYNTPAWKQFVVCQEVGHTFGLDHQDEVFNNVNLGTCMDYTNDPDGGPGGVSATDPSNEHPNTHDYDMLGEIYAHLDSVTTVLSSPPTKNGRALLSEVLENRSEWGKSVHRDRQGRDNVFARDLGRGNSVLTHVFWTE